MVCEGCGVEAPSLKTCRWRKGERLFPLCDGCWEAVVRYVWIVVGPVPAYGTCKLCGCWHSVRELEDAKPGGRRDAPSGLCQGCQPG